MSQRRLTNRSGSANLSKFSEIKLLPKNKNLALSRNLSPGSPNAWVANEHDMVAWEHQWTWALYNDKSISWLHTSYCQARDTSRSATPLLRRCAHSLSSDCCNWSMIWQITQAYANWSAVRLKSSPRNAKKKAPRPCGPCQESWSQAWDIRKWNPLLGHLVHQRAQIQIWKPSHETSC